MSKNESEPELVEVILPAPKVSLARRIVNYFVAGLVLTGPSP